MRSYAVSGGQLRRPTESAQILWILPTQFCRRLARGSLELRDLLPASSNFLADQNALIRSRPLLIAACSAFGAEMRRFSRVSLIATSRLSNSAMKPVNAIVEILDSQLGTPAHLHRRTPSRSSRRRRPRRLCFQNRRVLAKFRLAFGSQACVTNRLVSRRLD